MKTIAIPEANLVVSRLSFGTASLHHLPFSSGRRALLAAAWDAGFTHFDTSPYYGFGIAEHELGRFLKAARREATVATKVGLYAPGGRTSGTLAAWGRKAVGKAFPSISRAVVDWSVARATASLHESLNVLGRDHVDIVFLHEPAPGLLDADEFLRWCTKQKEAGKIKHWGLAGEWPRFSTWTRHPLAEIVQTRDLDAAALRAAGREPQFTYGALSSAPRGASVAEALRAALARNPRGSLVVSTRKIGRLKALAEAAD